MSFLGALADFKHEVPLDPGGSALDIEVGVRFNPYKWPEGHGMADDIGKRLPPGIAALQSPETLGRAGRHAGHDRRTNMEPENEPNILPYQAVWRFHVR